MAVSMERSLEAWEEVQRQGQDIADRFNSMAQGFTCLLNSHIKPTAFPWPPMPQTEAPNLGFPKGYSGGDGVSAIFDIGNRLGRAGAEFGAYVGGMVEHFFHQLPPLPQLRPEEKVEILGMRPEQGGGSPISGLLEFEREEEGKDHGGWREFGRSDSSFSGMEMGNLSIPEAEESVEEEVFGLSVRSSSTGRFARSQGSVNITSTYDSRTNGIESSVIARGDLWRVEASHGSSTSGHDSSPLFLVQLGPVLFVRDTTLLLPVHLSKQHLLWYGFDRKNGVHSICPALWSKQRRWLLMSMICLNPLACSFMDLQFPNGQLTYVAGEGLTASAFLPIFGGLLQAQGRLPGETRVSFSCKNKRGTRFTSTVQWPDKSLSLGVMQALAWQRSGLMVRPTVQFSVSPTFGGSNPGLRAELIHSVREKLNLICGYACTTQPSAFASIALGRSKWNGHAGNAGVVLSMEVPTTNHGRAAFSIQLNSGLEF
ncbi:uncharacterized protein LOC116260822 [Nymphaea colorata]|nr:uncharacterized protein LOC116260822 [Nymphaea colorata]